MKKRNVKKIVCLIILLSLICGCTSKEKSKNSNTTGVNIDGSIISWANMKIDNPKLKLSEEEKNVLLYFDNDYFEVNEYDCLQQYPKIFREAQIHITGTVAKVLKSDDDSYECVVEMGNYWDPDVEAQSKSKDDFVPSGKNCIVVSGKQADKRIVKGDCLGFYGRYTDVKPFSIDGKEEYYPSMTVNYTVAFTVFDGEFERFTMPTIKNVAKTILGNDVKIKEPELNVDFVWDDFHYSSMPKFYVVTPDNQSNSNFSKFEFGAKNGYIRYTDSNAKIEKNFYVSADFKHYIVTTFEHSLHLMYLEYFDRDYKKLWSREFENVDTVALDYTVNKIYLNADNDLYSINTSDGKDAIAPVLVGKKLKINVLKDSILLFGYGNKDNIMKITLNGEIVWKTSANIDTNYCPQAQVINDNIVVEMGNLQYEQTVDTDDMQFAQSEYITAFTSKLIAVDKDGNIISEFISSQFDLNEY